MKRISIIAYSFLFFFIIQNTLCYGQKANGKAQQHFDNAVKFLEVNNSEKAIAELNRAIKQDTTYASAYQQLGDIYRKQKKYTEAIPSYQKVMALNPDLTPLTKFGLGECLIHIGNYDQAVVYFTQYLKSNLSDKSRKLTNKYILDCRFALENPQILDIQLHKLPTSINTGDDEYFPKLTADSKHIIFTRKEKNQENFYESDFMGHNSWSDAQKLIGAVNSETYNEGAHCISPDGKYLFFTGCNRPNGLGSCDIYVSKKENGIWSKPTNLGAPINTKGWEAQPAISADGRTLYFVSNRQGGYGGNDIWKSELGQDGKWQTPINLGKNINTEYDESSPYIHADNTTLYFASNGWPGYGGQDLYVSTLDSINNWSVPLNLGQPINNHLNQTAIHVSVNGAIGFFSSQDSTKQLDIYTFDLPQAIQPHPVTYIAGTVLDIETKQPLSAQISVINTSNQHVLFKDVADYLDGKFIATLPIGENYAVHIQNEGYLFDSKQYDLRDIKLANERFEIEVLLSPIKSGNSTNLGNMYFDINKFDLLPASRSDLQLLLAFLKINSTVHIEIGGHTDNTGNKEHNRVLSENRAKSVYNYLIQNGIPAERISSVGYGDDKPIAPNDTPESRQMNRRTEISVLK